MVCSKEGSARRWAENNASCTYDLRVYHIIIFCTMCITHLHTANKKRKWVCDCSFLQLCFWNTFNLWSGHWVGATTPVLMIFVRESVVLNTDG